jgi:hypothetical protein
VRRPASDVPARPNKVIAEAKPPAIMYEGLCPRIDTNRYPTGATPRRHALANLNRPTWANALSPSLARVTARAAGPTTRRPFPVAAQCTAAPPRTVQSGQSAALAARGPVVTSIRSPQPRHLHNHRRMCLRTCPPSRGPRHHQQPPTNPPTQPIELRRPTSGQPPRRSHASHHADEATIRSSLSVTSGSRLLVQFDLRPQPGKAIVGRVRMSEVSRRPPLLTVPHSGVAAVGYLTTCHDRLVS